ncbi:hypothetical protein [Streptomyces sp. NRRL B-24484]|uniref:hypothetical protein n=1 Tax=Streptomyces sp. NRRL B-24484 TaxID=1463833 RepID=UPI0004C121A8|nr:hypothetical protein [Streptomyces sp. NRRL B-24484]
MPKPPRPHRTTAQQPAVEGVRHERAVLAALGELLDGLAALGGGEPRFGSLPSIVVRRPAIRPGPADLDATA